MTIEKQPGFDPRLAWASEGGTLLAGACPVLVVVDILRFTTAVEVAVANGALVVPERWAGRERQGLSSLSPVSLLGVPAGTRVTLASPNGATVSLAVAEVVQHVLEAGPELARITGPALVFEDAHHLPTHALGVLGSVGDLRSHRLGPFMIF